MKNIEVRAATAEHALTLAILNDHIHQMHVNAVPSFFKKKTLKEAQSIFEQILALDNANAFIAWEKDTAVGYILSFIQYREETLFTYARRFVVIDQVSVNPEWHGKGIGGLLFDTILKLANQYQIDEIDASTWYFNTEGHAFFESFGFKPQLSRVSLKLSS